MKEFDWYKKAQNDSDSSWKSFWKNIYDAKVYLVDGNYVRTNIEIEYTLGGHHYRYNFIPEDEIWIEKLENSFDMDSNLFHEIYERELMKKWGDSYDEAHDQASKKEQEFRKTYNGRNN